MVRERRPCGLRGVVVHTVLDQVNASLVRHAFTGINFINELFKKALKQKEFKKIPKRLFSDHSTYIFETKIK